MSKKSPRHLARSLAIQAIYYYKLNNHATSNEITAFLEQFNHDLYISANQELMHSLIEGGINKYDEMLAYYKPYLQREVADINLVEQAILVVAAFEITNVLSVPAPVIINEAVELAKLYGGADAHKFVNNLVDKVAKEIRSEEYKHYANKK